MKEREIFVLLKIVSGIQRFLVKLEKAIMIISHLKKKMPPCKSQELYNSVA